MKTSDKEKHARIKLLKKHFPGRDPWESDLEFFLNKRYLLASDLSATVSLQEEIEKLENFGKAISDAWAIYSTMSLQTKTAMNKIPESSAGTSPEETRDLGSGERRRAGFERTRENLLRELIALHRAVHGHNPGKYQHQPGASRDPGMIKTAKLELASLFDLNPQARAKENDQKIQFAQTARGIWKRYTETEAPVKSTVH